MNSDIAQFKTNEQKINSSVNDHNTRNIYEEFKKFHIILIEFPVSCELNNDKFPNGE